MVEQPYKVYLDLAQLTLLTPAMPPCSLGIFALELAWGSAMPWITFLLKARGDGEMEDTGGFGPEQQGNDKELGWIKDEGGNTNNKKQR